jgi:Protein of unknown function (DUF3987)
VLHTEFSGVLKVMTREGNTLSEMVRDAWDGRSLHTLTKMPQRATAPHISILGQTTQTELQRYLNATESGNGFGNRFLWLCVKRSKELPDGGCLPDLDVLRTRLCNAVECARHVGPITRSEAANRLWHRRYSRLSAGRPGLLGAMTARAETQVVRLSALYALTDNASLVDVPHLRAALALWRYCFNSAKFLFGDRLGDPGG